MPKNKEILTSPAVLEHLGKYVELLPPVISRKRVDWFTGGAITSKKMANDDALCKGPRVREKWGEAVVYPTPYFLEYVEKLGVRTIVVPQI